MAEQVGLDIGVGVLERVSHAGLGGEMNDMGDLGVFGGKRLDGLPYRDVPMLEGKGVVLQQPVAARFLQRHVIVVVQVIDTDDPLAAGKQRLGQVITDESGRAGNKYRHRTTP